MDTKFAGKSIAAVHSGLTDIDQMADIKREREEGEGRMEEAVVKVNIKFGGGSIPVSFSLDSSVRDLKSILQPLTNVLPRGQKLIFKGKVLLDELTLRSSQVTDGAKIMLMASQGLHQGDGPIRKEAPASSNLRRMADANRGKEVKRDDIAAVAKRQFERWKATGVIALSECNLRAIPDEVWTCGPSARVLDLIPLFPFFLF
ncbi:hypothetical protein TEA_014576 [Camellia sinensis var. sinensis]|uniref:Ubiquitin-like domain-containing protein n=1 Tax=Camellia sinensis var. sinensis TaxID=542762 RepID=A0A4S4EA00_CAMSN|nr:hypothetical protein TEA_014576 [Camellia sinensis var. sinensis]